MVGEVEARDNEQNNDLAVQTLKSRKENVVDSDRRSRFWIRTVPQTSEKKTANRHVEYYSLRIAKLRN